MAELTPAEAVRVLDRLQGHEQHLSQQLGGITCMVWGVVNAAILMAYALASLQLDGPQRWTLAVLWVPFVAAGGALTQRLWRQHVLAFGGSDTSRRDTLVITAAFVVLGGVLFFGARLIGSEWSLHGLMTSVNGIVAAGLGVILRRGATAGWSHLVGAGTAMVLGGLLLGMMDSGLALAGLMSAAIVGASWFLAGFAIHQQG